MRPQNSAPRVERMHVKWYQLFSCWIFLLSIASGLGWIPYSTFPLNVVAVVGILAIVPHFPEESYLKYAVVVLLHLLPFLWVRYEYDVNTMIFCASMTTLYVGAMMIAKQPILETYLAMAYEKDVTFAEFMQDRF